MQLSDRMKFYERITAGQMLIPNLPICARLDGKAFHSWTRGLQRPFDECLQGLFDEVTAYLVEESNAIVGYTQSDEITLILYNGGHPESQIFFDGRVAKLTSVLASMATAKFNALVSHWLPEKCERLAFFDCRVWNVPSEVEAVNCLLWREQDATRNSIQMAAQCHYSHAQLLGKNSDEMQEMLFQKGVNWNDYSSRFKRGAYFRRVTMMSKFSVEELDKLPAKHEAWHNPVLMIERKVLQRLEMPPLQKVSNRVEVVFHGAEPIPYQLEQK